MRSIPTQAYRSAGHPSRSVRTAYPPVAYYRTVRVQNMRSHITKCGRTRHEIRQFMVPYRTDPFRTSGLVDSENQTHTRKPGCDLQMHRVSRETRPMPGPRHAVLSPVPFGRSVPRTVRPFCMLRRTRSTKN